MSGFQPAIGYLESCEPGELVRMRVGENTEWALTCARQSNFAHSIVILGGPNGACTRNLQAQGRVGDFDIPVLKYGKKFTFEIGHTGPVTIVVGESRPIAGRLLQCGDDLYLVAQMEEGGLDYIYLKECKLHSEPGGHRALYWRWRLIHEDIKKDGWPATLLEFDASVAIADSKAQTIKAPQLVP
jgi:hypothetical protein